MKPPRPPQHSKDSVEIVENETDCLELQPFDHSMHSRQRWERRTPTLLESFAGRILDVFEDFCYCVKESCRAIFESVCPGITKSSRVPQVIGIKCNIAEGSTHVLITLEPDKFETVKKFGLTRVSYNDSGTMVFSPYREVTPITAREDNIVDQILEGALQEGNFHAIRAILNFEGYGVPLSEPNDLVIPETRNADKSDKEDVIEIEMTAEDRQLWQEMKNAPPEEITEPEPFKDTVEYRVFVGRMARNIPLHFEEAIRNRDIPTLRMWLRLYGRHNIAAPKPGSALLGSHSAQDTSDGPPSLDL